MWWVDEGSVIAFLVMSIYGFLVCSLILISSYCCNLKKKTSEWCKGEKELEKMRNRQETYRWIATMINI